MLTAIEMLAVARAVSEATDRAASGAMPPGMYAVDVTVRVLGTVTKGKPYEQRIVAKAEPWALLGVALSKLNGVTMAALVREALAAEPAVADVVKAQAADAMAAVKAPTWTPCTGKVTTALVIEAVAADVERKAVA